MKGVISVILFILLRCHQGYALTCYSCSGNCEANTTKSCAPGEQCMTMEIFTAEGRLQERRMDCQDPRLCQNAQGYKPMVQKCCDQELCNDPRQVSATNIQPAVVNDTGRDKLLRCHSCDAPCIKKSVITCQAHEFCYEKTVIGIPERGCRNSSVCDSEASDNVAVKTRCCKTNMCNSAAHPEVPAVTLLAAIMVAWISRL